MNDHAATTTGARARGAYTLVELVLAVGITAIILVGAQSAVLIAAKAVPDGRGKNSAAMGAGSALEKLNADLCCAASIIESGLDTIEFTVPDRDGDRLEETIRYQRGGKDGDELVRTYNGTAQTVATRVKSLALSYEARQVQNTVTYVEGPEVQVFACTGALGTGNFAVNSSDWIGQVFRPTLPHGCTAWRLTSVQVMARSDGPATGEARVQVRMMGGNAPGSGVIAETPMLESALLTTYTNPIIPMDAPGLAAGSPVCIMIKWASGLSACEVQYQSLLAALSGVTVVTTGNSGASWSTQPLQALPMTVWGKPQTVAPATYTLYLRMVRCSLTVGEGGGVRTDMAVRMLNEPLYGGSPLAEEVGAEVGGGTIAP